MTLRSEWSFEDSVEYYGTTTDDVKKALVRTARFFEESPNRFRMGEYCSRPINGNPASFCLVGRFSVEIGLSEGRCHSMLSLLCQRWGRTLSDHDDRARDARHGRVVTLNDTVLADPEKVVKMLGEMAECV